MGELEKLLQEILSANQKKIVKCIQDEILQDLVVSCVSKYHKSVAKGEELSMGQLADELMKEFS